MFRPRSVKQRTRSLELCARAILRADRAIGAAHCKVCGPSAVGCVKTAEPIEVLFGVWTRVGIRKHVLGELPLTQPGKYD